MHNDSMAKNSDDGISSKSDHKIMALLDILILTLMHQQTGSADSSRYLESLRARYASLIKR